MINFVNGKKEPVFMLYVKHEKKMLKENPALVKCQ